jgi:hypothetical protein
MNTAYCCSCGPLQVLEVLAVIALMVNLLLCGLRYLTALANIHLLHYRTVSTSYCPIPFAKVNMAISPLSKPSVGQAQVRTQRWSRVGWQLYLHAHPLLVDRSSSHECFPHLHHGQDHQEQRGHMGAERGRSIGAGSNVS